jgi:methionyl-tRNA formyltransferase
MDAGLDTGPVLLEEAVSIAPDDTAQTLHDRLKDLGARLVVRALEETRVPQAQDASRATYAAKLDKKEAAIDWSERAAVIDRKVRAFNPVPGAVTAYAGIPLKVWRAEPAGRVAETAGTVVSADKDGVLVACGDGEGLRLTTLQRAGGKRLPAAAFLAGTPIARGDRLGD